MIRGAASGTTANQKQWVAGSTMTMTMTMTMTAYMRHRPIHIVIAK
ncbi:MAG: hypothetical protein QOG73_4092 [Acetobacteraceae bacterium]|jgi:hypothetical protein|nr:hypothetical protein [Acetobacteraceae bacterium]